MSVPSVRELGFSFGQLLKLKKMLGSESNLNVKCESDLEVISNLNVKSDLDLRLKTEEQSSLPFATISIESSSISLRNNK